MQLNGERYRDGGRESCPTRPPGMPIAMSERQREELDVNGFTVIESFLVLQRSLPHSPRTPPTS